MCPASRNWDPSFPPPATPSSRIAGGALIEGAAGGVFGAGSRSLGAGEREMNAVFRQGSVTGCQCDDVGDA